MLFECTEVFNFEGAIRGMRNPRNSWKLSDSGYCDVEKDEWGRGKNQRQYYNIGSRDLNLMRTLIKAGSEHRKFMRQIFVCVDITAPLYWWKEMDTYKVATVSNSCSTMHKLAETPITLECFEMSDVEDCETDVGDMSVVSFWGECLIPILERLRFKYNETKNKVYWKELIRLLPESWLQRRTITFNYETLFGICSEGQRRHHKLTEWSCDFMEWARGLPYAQELLFFDDKNVEGK